MAQVPAAPIADLTEGFTRASRFWTPVLAGEVTGHRWDVTDQMWRPLDAAGE
jgi:hypothetical protein